MNPRVWIFGPGAAWLVVAGVGLAQARLSPPEAVGVGQRREAPVVGSDDCRRCHPDEWSTWHASFHRTMTQDLGVVAPAAPFAGEHLDYGGYRATMSTSEQGRPHLRVRALDEPEAPALLDVDVELSVGSHRYQQYVARLDRGGGPDERWRLPVAWDLRTARWIHLNGAFVEPEGVPGDEGAYLRHLSRWNDNCNFCHNTQPTPGLQEGVYTTHVGEYGIACEACHGSARAHVARHADPFARLLARGEGDESITHPARLGPARAADVCGRCHGNRIGHDIASILERGDAFLPGQPLEEVSRPIFHDSQVAGMDPDPFAARFWPDESPRLSAYEYQGLLMSPCFDETSSESLDCGHCHDMHGDEPDMQVRRGREGDAACTQCHEPASLGGATTPGGHGGHGEVAPAVDCLSCHMPRTTYGLLEGMISHRITSPDPGAWLGRQDMPDACTQCHVDRSREWASDAMADVGLHASTPSAPALPIEAKASRVALDLLGGDPLQRNLAAHALARQGATGEARMRMAWLVDGMEDEYPSVRWFSWRGLTQLAEAEGDQALQGVLARFDYLGDPAARTEVTADLRARLGPGAVDEATLQTLQSGREDKAIWIGE